MGTKRQLMKFGIRIQHMVDMPPAPALPSPAHTHMRVDKMRGQQQAEQLARARERERRNRREMRRHAQTQTLSMHNHEEVCEKLLVGCNVEQEAHPHRHRWQQQQRVCARRIMAKPWNFSIGASSNAAKKNVRIGRVALAFCFWLPNNKGRPTSYPSRASHLFQWSTKWIRCSLPHISEHTIPLKSLCLAQQFLSFCAKMRNSAHYRTFFVPSSVLLLCHSNACAIVIGCYAHRGAFHLRIPCGY